MLTCTNPTNVHKRCFLIKIMEKGEKGRELKRSRRRKEKSFKIIYLCSIKRVREFCLFCVRLCFIFQMILVFLFSSKFQLKNFHCPYIQWSAGHSSVHNVPATQNHFVCSCLKMIYFSALNQHAVN